MYYLTLHFLNSSQPELDETEFVDGAASRRATRGLSSRGGGADYSFPWSSAVQALSLVMLQTKSWGLLDPEERVKRPQPALSGVKASLASSLDYAFSKQPAWLLEMFGSDSQGISVARKFIERNNPERKRPGPVFLTVRSSRLPPENIRIFLDNQEVVCRETLLLLAESIAHRAGDGEASLTFRQTLSSPLAKTSRSRPWIYALVGSREGRPQRIVGWFEIVRSEPSRDSIVANGTAMWVHPSGRLDYRGEWESDETLDQEDKLLFLYRMRSRAEGDPYEKPDFHEGIIRMVRSSLTPIFGVASYRGYVHDLFEWRDNSLDIFAEELSGSIADARALVQSSGAEIFEKFLSRAGRIFKNP